jgi:hypothetical protein
MSLELATAIYASSLTGEVAKLPVEPSDRCYRGVTDAEYRARARAAAEVTVG